MDWQTEISKLVQFKPTTTAPFFSIYLNSLKTQVRKSTGEVFLKKVISGFENFYSESGYDSSFLKKEKQFLENFARDLPLKQASGFGLFMNGAKNLFEIVELPFSPEDKIFCQLTPNLYPLVRLEEDLESFMTVVLDIRQARILTIALGKISESVVMEKESLEDVRRRGKLGLYKTRLERRIDEYTEKFVENVITLVKKKAPIFSLFAGDEVILPVVEKKLSSLKTFAYDFLKLDIKASDSQVLSKSLEVHTRIKKQKRSQILKEFLDNLGSGQKIVSGFEKVFEAFKNDNILYLVIGLKPGYEICFCPFCWFWEKIVKLKTCPNCNLPLEVVDYKHKIVNLAYNSKVKLDFVEEDFAFEKKEGVGAYLKR